ncbi:MAG: glycosyl hydrolase, partial [Bacteroidales bacterium]
MNNNIVIEMKKMKISIVISALFSIIGLLSAQSKIPVYRDINKSTEERVIDICRLMTLEEKADFLAGVDHWYLKGVKRLGIPSLQVTDCGHGVTIILD